MTSRTYVQMYVESGMCNYIVKNKSYYMNALMNACQYLDNHPEKVEEVVMDRVRVGKLTRLIGLEITPRTSFQWLFLELQIINSWILDEQFSGDAISIIPLSSTYGSMGYKPEACSNSPNPIYTPKHIQHRKRGRR